MADPHRRFIAPTGSHIDSLPPFAPLLHTKRHQFLQRLPNGPDTALGCYVLKEVTLPRQMSAKAVFIRFVWLRSLEPSVGIDGDQGAPVTAL